MLLQHAWLAYLDKPATIAEEDEEAAEAAAEAEANGEAPPPAAPAAETVAEPLENATQFVDQEVGEWVIQALEKKRNGTLGKSAKPALHAAPLDATASM